MADKERTKEDLEAEVASLRRQLAEARAQEERIARAQAELAAMRVRLAEAERVAGVGSWDWNLVTDTIAWSDGLYEIFGLPPEKVNEAGRSFLGMVHSSDLEEVKSRLGRALYLPPETGGGSFDHEYRIVLPGGPERWVHTRGKVDYEDEREPVRIMGTLLDITRRKQHEQEREKLIDELTRARDELRRLSYRDGLTGVYNRRHFDDRLQREYDRLARQAEPLSLIMADIDYFKAYNDTYGHQAGDDCLKGVARSLAGALGRPADFLARYGGEEFAAVLPGTDLQGALHLAEVMHRAVTELDIEHRSSRVGARVTVSMGVATAVPVPESGPEQIIAVADQALYQAKQEGRDRIVSQKSPPLES
ncbi:MAG: diguanylate cyclase [Proteobacteria bacterium]|nr:diguanylate cyclase [Pseudomonadota bacterium]MBU1740663.1 diguanylate cyclase [Pseudomonadota bacterium]